MLVLAMFLTVAVRQLVLHHGGQQMAIPGDTPTPLVATPRAATPSVDSYQHDFVTTVSADGRYFLDQAGRPLLIRGDSPWALLTELSPSQAEPWFANRSSRDSMPPSSRWSEQRPMADPRGRRHFRRAHPFDDGDVLKWGSRTGSGSRLPADGRQRTASRSCSTRSTAGPSVQSSSPDRSISATHTVSRCASDFADLPNIVWMSGGDYFPATRGPGSGSDVDHCIDADDAWHPLDRGRADRSRCRWRSASRSPPRTRSGRSGSTGTSSTPTTRLTRPSRTPTCASPRYRRSSARRTTRARTTSRRSPETTDETLRRQVIWALTSGAAGEFIGSDDWEFHDGLGERLSTPRCSTQIDRMRDLFASSAWWQLVPDAITARHPRPGARTDAGDTWTYWRTTT